MRHVVGMGMGLMALATGPALAQVTPSPAQTPAQAPKSDDKTTTVVVSAKAPTVIHKIDRTVYDLKDNPQAVSGNISDVLGTLPSVTVDNNGNVSVRGGSVQIVIDGKPSPVFRGNNLAQALQAMPANTVARVEVITNPGPEFRSDAATVINIITKKTGTRAPTGSLVLNAGDYGRANGTVSGTFGVGKWTFNGTLSLRQDRRPEASHDDRLTFNSDGSVATHMVEVSRGQQRRQPTNIDLGASYAASDNDTFSLAASGGVRPRNRLGGIETLFLDPASGAVLSDSVTNTTGPTHYNNVSLSGTWKHKGRRDGETFTLQARHDEGAYLQDIRFWQTDYVPAPSLSAYRQYLTDHQLTDDINGDYVLPLGTDTQFKTGFDIESTRDTTFSNTGDIDIATGAITPRANAGNGYFLIDQTLSAAYVDYQHPIGKWRAEAGLRVENMLTRIRYGRTAPQTSSSDLQWSPSLYLSRDLTEKSKLKFSYSHRIDRPNSDQLFGLQQIQDAYSVYSGNPNLKPAQTESFEAGYDYTTRPVSFTGTLYRRQTRDTIVNYSYYIQPDKTVLYTSIENAGRGTLQGLDMSLDLHVWPKVDVSVSSDIFHVEQTAPVGTLDVRQSLTTAQTKLGVTLNPTKADSLLIQVMDNGRQLEANGWSDSKPGLNLSYTRKISPKLKLVATLNNAANSLRWREHVATSQYRDDSVFQPRGRTFYVGLDYKLGAVKGDQAAGASR